MVFPIARTCWLVSGYSSSMGPPFEWSGVSMGSGMFMGSGVLMGSACRRSIMRGFPSGGNQTATPCIAALLESEIPLNRPRPGRRRQFRSFYPTGPTPGPPGA